MKHALSLTHIFLLAALYTIPCASAVGKPRQVFILAGQPNMQGHAKVSPFEHIGMNPVTKPKDDAIKQRVKKLVTKGKQKPTEEKAP